MVSLGGWYAISFPRPSNGRPRLVVFMSRATVTVVVASIRNALSAAEEVVDACRAAEYATTADASSAAITITLQTASLPA